MTLFSTPQNEPSNVNSLFTHSKAEALLQRICHSVERHEIELTTLRCEIDSSHAQSRKDIENIQTVISDMKSQLDDLNHRVKLVEESTRIPGSSSSKMTSIGEAVLANRRTLARTLNLVSQKADGDQVKESFESHSKHIQDVMEQCKSDLVSNDAIEKSNEALSALVSRVDVIANDMCNKVDKCLLKTLSSDAASIRNYANFVRSTQSTTTKFESELEDIRVKILNFQNKIHSFEDEVQRINIHLNNQIVTNEKFEKANSTAVQSMMKELQTKVSMSAIAEIQNNISQQSKNELKVVEDDIKTLFSAHETLAKYLTKRLDDLNNKTMTMITDEGLRSKYNYVTLEELEDGLQKVASVIDSKAYGQTLSELQEDVQQLESDLCITKRKADLAAQFVGLCGKERGGEIIHEDNLR